MTNRDVAVATPSNDDDAERPEQSLAEQLVDQARADGVDLVGPGGLLADLTKHVLETGLEVEMDEHLGHAKHAAEGCNGGNSRNGTRSKQVITEVGPVDIDVPRDRDASFEPKTVRKNQRRLDGVDSMVISLTAKGLTTGEVEAHLAEVHSTEISREWRRRRLYRRVRRPQGAAGVGRSDLAVDGGADLCAAPDPQHVPARVAG